MSDTQAKSGDTQPLAGREHPLPRRAAPQQSVTLHHHRRAREPSIGMKVSSADKAAEPTPSRRASSGGSQYTGNSDPKKWFDQSNQNPFVTYGGGEMDVDPPFFQKESESSNEDGNMAPYRFGLPSGPNAMLKPKSSHHQSSSAGDYRSVIDDLTVEIQKLKEELKRYKQPGPDMLKGDKLFEVKMHGLPQRKKRELEETLRQFAVSLDGTTTSNGASSQRKKSSGTTSAGQRSTFKKTSSNGSQSRSRPVDSAYASMSTGNNSSGASFGRSGPSMSSRGRTSDQKVESYLDDIPAGLYPRHMRMTDKEKKKLVVKRLEQLFTGRITGRHFRLHKNIDVQTPVVTEAQLPQLPSTSVPPPSVSHAEACREARIVPPETLKKPQRRDAGPASNSNGDHIDHDGYGIGNGNVNSVSSSNLMSFGGGNLSPPLASPAEQRPTRPLDLDPDRVQVPSENMDYIRHLGLVPPELLPEDRSMQDVSPDADGWVYLNLLSNLAQLHMIHVAPNFIRAAVREKSTNLQLSPDGRKIRWRGGVDGTKFSSDSSVDNSLGSPMTDETDGSDNNNHRKRTKAKHSSSDDLADEAKFGPPVLGASDYETIHYKPLFAHQSPSVELMSQDTCSSYEQGPDSNLTGQEGREESYRRKRHSDGAIIYYSGAPFCLDLSGDTSGTSPTSYLESSGRDAPSTPHLTAQTTRPPAERSDSGSLLRFRPLSQNRPANFEMNMNVDSSGTIQGLKTDSALDDGNDFDLDMPWSTDTQVSSTIHLEPSGLGGVVPDDHFVVGVTTRRPKVDASRMDIPVRSRVQISETASVNVNRVAAMNSSSSMPWVPWERRQKKETGLELSYLSGRVKRLEPVPLPAPASFLPPFSSSDSDDSMSFGFDSEADDDTDSGSELISRRANRHGSVKAYIDNIDVSAGDDEDFGGEQEPVDTMMKDDNESEKSEDMAMEEKKALGTSVTGTKNASGSSVATAGGLESGYSSSVEDVE